MNDYSFFREECLNQAWSLKKAKEAAGRAAKKAATKIVEDLTPATPATPATPYGPPLPPAETPQWLYVLREVAQGFLGTCACAASIAGLVWLGRRYGLWAFLGRHFADIWARIRGQLAIKTAAKADVEAAIRSDDDPLPNLAPSQDTLRVEVEARTPQETLRVEARAPLELDERLPVTAEIREAVDAEIREAVEAETRPPVEGPPPASFLTFEVDDRILRPNARGRRHGYNIYSRRQPKKAARGRRGRRHN